MKLLIPLLLSVSFAFAQPSLTPVQDTVYDTSGNLYNGALTVTLSMKSGTANGLPVVSTIARLQIKNGALSVSLVPNANITPSGSTYLITYGNGGLRTCTIPVSVSPVTLAANCTDNPPSNPQPDIPWAWITMQAGSPTNCVHVNGSNGACGSGGGGWTVNVVPCSASPTFDFSLGNVQQLTLSCNVTSSATANIPTGTPVMFSICQNGTGGYSFTWPGAINAGVLVGTTAGKCSSQWFYSVDGVHLISQGIGVINQ